MPVPKVEHWGVDVRINGEHVLSIESGCLSGIENITDYRDTIIECAHHLLAFIGPAEPQEFIEGVEQQPATAQSTQCGDCSECCYQSRFSSKCKLGRSNE